MYETEFKQIINAAKNHSLTFFVGAGVSCISGAPLWSDIIDKICTKLELPIQDTYSSDESLKLAQILYVTLNDINAYYAFINECLAPANNYLEPNDVHKALFDLNPVSFITTNFDELLEISAMQYCQSFICVAKDTDVPTINGSKYILKIHGDIKNQNIVFKEEDYLNYSENFKLIETLLKSIFSTNTVVFIGYSLNDYNVKLILNWAKSLLKEQFNQPIFIYTDKNELTQHELLYQDSRGLHIIDWHQINNTDTTEYIHRYMIVLNAIKNSQDIYLEGKSKDEAFDILYALLEPLNKLQALRPMDIKEKLREYVYIRGYECIIFDDKHNILLQYFLEIHALSIEERNKLDCNIQKKYETMLSIFIKARIEYIVMQKTRIQISKNMQNNFSNTNCLHFNYAKMRKHINISEDSLQSNYMKAFYLCRLSKYDKALELFALVAKEAYLSKNYILYYLCEVNKITVNEIIESYNLDINEHVNINIYTKYSKNYKNIFENLPIEFQDKYANLKYLYSIKQFLQEYSYRAFIDVTKLKHSIDENYREFGLTSSDEAIYRINEYLHFILGNGLIIDIFTEYRNTITYTMELLVHKYSTQNKRSFMHYFEKAYNNIVFDYIDFYCFLEYFTKEAINKLFNKYDIQFITFQQQEIIENNIKNILSNYEYVMSDNSSEIEIISVKKQIKKLIVLLRYINISQDLMNYFCNFLLKNNFYELFRFFEIEEYVLFFDTQIGVKKLYSDASKKLLIKSLLYFLDMDIKLVENGHESHLCMRNINYHYLIHYIYPQESIRYDRSIRTRVSYIIQKKLDYFLNAILEHYINYVSPYMKQKLYKYLIYQLDNYFDINKFIYLLYYKKKVLQDLIYKAKQYLENILKDVNKLNDNLCLQELEHIGYLCLIKRLNKEDFINFLGKSDLFDFFVLYQDFDYAKFNVKWLLQLSLQTLKNIAKNHFVRKKISYCIIEEIKNDKIIDIDKDKLTQILITYFY